MLEFNGTLLIALISFVIFMFLMNMILYKPMLEIVEKRKRLLAQNQKETDANRQQTQNLTNEKSEKLQEARFESRQIISEIVDEAKSKKNDIVAETTQNAQNRLQSTKNELSNEAQNLKNAVKNDVVELAQEILTKVTGREIAITNVDENKINEVMNNGL